MALQGCLKGSLGLYSLRAPNILGFLPSGPSLGVCCCSLFHSFATTPAVFLAICFSPVPSRVQLPLPLADIPLSPLQVAPEALIQQLQGG